MFYKYSNTLCGLHSVVLGLMDMRAGLCCRVSSFLSLLLVWETRISLPLRLLASSALPPAPSLSLIHHLSFFLPPPSLCFLLLLECSAWQHLSAACLLSAAPHHGERDRKMCRKKNYRALETLLPHLLW